MELNVKLLRRIQEHILEEPRRFVMKEFTFKKEVLQTNSFPGDGKGRVKFANCGTAACIAGWAVFLEDGIEAEPDNFRSRASDLLNLPPDKSWSDCPWMHDDIFEHTSWPQMFQDAYIAAKSQKQRVKVAVKFIDHLIETKGHPERISSVTL